MMINMNFTEPIAIYIHIPFCKQKCLYCDFLSFSNKECIMDKYIDSLCKEIYKINGIKIKSIFLGGGTPTYLNIRQLNLLKDAILSLNAGDVEFTCECNPGTVDAEKLKVLSEMGVNRLSIGLQAYQDKLLKKLGRIHNREEFLKAYEMSRQAKFTNINIDIMFGVPDQTLDDWEETLNNVLKLSPQHISCYSLIIEEGTPFYSLNERGDLKLPDEETERKMYSMAIELLGMNGYSQYEISNFSRKGYESIHNLVYWKLEPYLGIGAGAHSFINGKRFRKKHNIDEYIKCINDNTSCVEEVHINSIEDSMEEYMFMGLRKIEGISIKDFNDRFNRDIFEIYRDVIDKYINTGHIIIKGDRLFLSMNGICISNYIMSDFILT